jgi:hypothetical protein
MPTATSTAINRSKALLVAVSVAGPRACASETIVVP